MWMNLWYVMNLRDSDSKKNTKPLIVVIVAVPNRWW